VADKGGRNPGGTTTNVNAEFYDRPGEKKKKLEICRKPPSVGNQRKKRNDQEEKSETPVNGMGKEPIAKGPSFPSSTERFALEKQF